MSDLFSPDFLGKEGVVQWLKRLKGREVFGSWIGRVKSFPRGYKELQEYVATEAGSVKVSTYRLLN